MSVSLNVLKDMALIKNNAMVAADIAVHLAQLQQKDYSSKNVRSKRKPEETKMAEQQPVSTY